MSVENGGCDRHLPSASTWTIVHGPCDIYILEQVLHFDFRRCRHIDLPALLSARSGEVDPSIDAPEGANSQSYKGFPGAHSSNCERADQVEQHANEIGQHTEHRNEHVFEAVEGVMFAKRDDRNDARHHVKQECPEVADQRHDDKALRNACGQIVAEDSEAVPEIVRQPFNDVIGKSGGTTEVEN